MNIPDPDVMTVLVGANRYYMGRMTYAVSSWCDFLIAIWPQLPADVQGIIREDVDDGFVRDDRARYGSTSQNSYFPLGGDCDRAAWQCVRELWA